MDNKLKTTVARSYGDGKVAVSEVITDDPAKMTMWDLMDQVVPDDGSRTVVLSVEPVQEWRS